MTRDTNRMSKQEMIDTLKGLSFNSFHRTTANENEKAMKLHKETDCPLFSCIEAIKTDDPIKYLQGKSKLQG